MIRILLLVSLFLAAPAFAQQVPAHSYIPIVDSNDMEVFVDAKTMQSSGNMVTVWELWVHEPKARTSSGKLFRYSLSKSTYDCTNKTVTDHAGVFYDENGSSVASYEDNPYIQPSTIIPESVAEGTLLAVCSQDFPGTRMAFNSLAAAVAVGKIHVLIFQKKLRPN
jgi:hypothetical protein